MLCRWLEQVAYPWQLGEIRIYLQPNYLSWHTDICIRTDLFGEQPFWCFIKSDELLNLDEYELAGRITEAFYEKFNDLYILPEDHIELGEN